MSRPVTLIADDLRLPGLRPLVTHWLALLQRDGRVPRLRDLDPLAFAPSMRHAWIIDAEDDGGFRFRLSGEALIEWYGVNLKGKRYDEVFPAVTLAEVVPQSRRVLDTPAAVYQERTARMPDWTEPAAFERIGLPLADADGRVRHLLGATLFAERVYNGKGSIDTAPLREYWYDLPPAGAAG
jgi:hypothetical protein